MGYLVFELDYFKDIDIYMDCQVFYIYIIHFSYKSSELTD